MNWATESLLRPSWSGSRKAAEAALSVARIFPFDPQWKDRVKRDAIRQTLYVHLPESGRKLDVAGLIFSSTEELERAEGLFRKNKPLFRAAM